MWNIMRRRRTKNSDRKGPSRVNKWESKREGNQSMNIIYMRLSGVPHVFSSLPPPLFSGGLLGEGPEQHITLGFRGCQYMKM